eukprot:5427453-Alexandrium_andersonii.AAC.1
MPPPQQLPSYPHSPHTNAPQILRDVSAEMCGSKSRHAFRSRHPFQIASHGRTLAGRLTGWE